MTINLATFRQNLIYEVTAPTAMILQDLNDLSGIDSIAEGKQSFFTKLMIGCIVGVVLSIFIFFVQPVLGVVLLLFLAIAAIYAGVMRTKHSRLNLDNQRYELTKRILTLLERDLDNEAILNVRLVLSPPTEKSKLTNTLPDPYRPEFKIDLFTDEWLKIQGQFVDKTRFILNITELYQTKYGWKRSASGKNKYKSKSKPKGGETSLALTYPQRRYGAIKVMQNVAVNAVKLPKDILLKRLKIMDRKIEITTKTPPSLAGNSDNLYQTVTMMNLSVYQILNLAQTLSKKKKV